MIDYDFISELEGGRILRGYVPDVKNSKSGVTIATGFDIGQRNVTDLINLFPASIVNKLSPYVLFKGVHAQKKLEAIPLIISEKDAKIIDTLVKLDMLDRLENRYNSQSQYTFSELPNNVQTVIASVAFQYGDLSKRTPKFWGYALRCDYSSMYQELCHFGDKYPTRRKKEAAILKPSSCCVN